MVSRKVLVLGLVATLLVACSETQTLTPENDILILPPSSTPANSCTALVTHVVDGDTVDVEFHSREVRIRLIGVDTPEVYFGVECFGPEASDFTESKLEGEAVRLEFDVDRIDPYDRTLAYLWLGDRLFNRTLVAKG